MRHNKIIGWDKFLEVVERVHKVSPWLSRQIAKRASEWPYWYTGLSIQEWDESHVWVQSAPSFRNTVDGEISHGHLSLGAELSVRLVLLRLRQEFPFRYRVCASRGETHHAVDQTVDFKFKIDFAEWEALRLELARNSKTKQEFAVQARLADGRSAGIFNFEVAFELEKFLSA